MLVVALRVPADQRELAADRLWSAGARAVEEVDLGEGASEVRTTLGPDHHVARERIGVLPDGWEFVAHDLPDEPSQAWRQHAVTVEVSDRLVLHPAWLATPDHGDALVVEIEPGGSFGLGDHPTTRLSAAATDRLVASGDHVLDVGCGSGVLAIVAARRGAATVTAIDIAEEARVATLDNAQRNRVGDRIHASTRPLTEIHGAFDLVLANILAPAIIELADDLRRVTRIGGRLVLSGVLSDGFDHVIEALTPMDVETVDDLDGWAAVTLRHPR